MAYSLVIYAVVSLFILIKHATMTIAECGNGKYYNSTTGVWASWNSTWTIGMWFGGTSDDCVKWSGSKYFDLDTLKCYSVWPGNSLPVSSGEGYVVDYLQTARNSSGSFVTTSLATYDIAVWKPVDTYINIYTGSTIEFGTVKYPFKYLEQAIYDAYNFPSDTSPPTATSINIQKIGSTALNISTPILLQNASMSFNVYGSSSSLTLSMHPSSSIEVPYTSAALRYRIRGPTEYVSPFECLPTPSSSFGSGFLNLYNSNVTLNNFVLDYSNFDTSDHSEMVACAHEDYFSSVSVNQGEIEGFTGILAATKGAMGVKLQDVTLQVGAMQALFRSIRGSTGWPNSVPDMYLIVTDWTFLFEQTGQKDYTTGNDFVYFRGYGEIDFSNNTFSGTEAVDYDNFIHIERQDVWEVDYASNTVDITENTFEDIDMSRMKSFLKVFSYDDFSTYETITISNNIFSNAKITKFAQIDIENTSSRNSITLSSNSFFNIYSPDSAETIAVFCMSVTTGKVIMSGTSIGNSSTESVFDPSLLYLSYIGTSISISNTTVRNITSLLSPMFSLRSPTISISETTLSGSTFTHPFLNVLSMNDFGLSTTSVSYWESGSPLIYIDQLGSQSTLNNVCSINGVSISNSAMPMLHLNRFITGATKLNTMTVSNVVSHDNQYALPAIHLGKFNTNYFRFYFNYSSFTDDSTGSNGEAFIKLEWRVPSRYIIINDVDFTDIEATNVFVLSPYDEQQGKQYIQIANSTFQYMEVDHVLSVRGDVDLYVILCNYYNITSAQNGAVLYMGYEKGLVSFERSQFIGNYGVLGGVFYARYEAEIYCSRWVIQGNGASIAAASYLTYDSLISYDTWTFYDNYADKYPLMYFERTVNKKSVITNSDISSNKLSDTSTSSEIALIKLNYGYLSITSTRTQYQSYLLKATSSSICYITDISYLNPTTINGYYSTIFTVTSSTLTMSSSTISNILAEDGCWDDSSSSSLCSALFTVVSSSTLTISNSTFDMTNTQLFQCDSSSLSLTNNSKITNSNVTAGHLLKAKGWDVFIDLYSMSDISVADTDVMHFSEGSTVTLDNCTFSKITGRLIRIVSSDLTITDTHMTGIGEVVAFGTVLAGVDSNVTISGGSYQDFHAENNGGVIWVSQSLNYRQTVRNALKIKDDVVFTNNSCGYNGGAIYTENIDAYITGGTYHQHSSTNGGVAFLSWSLDTIPIWSYTVSSVTGTSNTASVYGGFLYTDLYKPDMSNNIFSGNSASYGTNYGAYPINIYLNNTIDDMLNLVSGRELDDPLVYIAYDFFGQVSTNLGNRLAALQIDSDTIQLEEQNRASSNEGVFSFDQTVVQGLPGTSGVLTFLTSAIDLDKYEAVYGEKIDNLVIDTPFEIQYWVRGEAEEQYIWVVWEATTYTLVDNSSYCENCPANAVCPGGDSIVVDEGFWRASVDTDVVFECLNINGCLGGLYSDWNTGYYGKLCNECVYNETMKYSRSREYDCSAWPSIFENVMSTSFLTLFLWCYISFLTYSNYTNAIKEKDSTVMLRIFTMYLQIYGIIASFDAMSTLIYQYVNVLSYGGETSSKILYSLDWFLLSRGFEQNTLYIIKLVTIAFLPIIGGALAGIIYFVIWLITKNSTKVKGLYIVTLSVLYYLFYPTIVKFTINLLNWVELEDGIWLKANTNIKCWDSTHIAWITSIGVPVFWVWILGVPSIILLTLRVKQKDLDSERNLRALGFWYIGLKRKTARDNETGEQKQNDESNTYYWELLMELRKTMLILVNTIGSGMNLFYRAFIMLLILYITCTLVAKIKPYRKEYLNRIHYIADFAALITFGTAVGLEEVKSDAVKYILFVGMLITNATFLAYFVFQFANFTIRDKLKQNRLKREKELLKEAEDFMKMENFDKNQSSSIVRRRKKHRENSNTLYKYRHAEDDLGQDFRHKLQREHLATEMSRNDTSLFMLDRKNTSPYNTSNIDECYKEPRKRLFERGRTLGEISEISSSIT